MKNKMGFTLIELLAVIVILAIIALIAVPVIMNILDKANKSAFKDTAYGLISAAELYYSEQQLDLNGVLVDKTFNLPTDVNTEDGLQIKGNIPTGAVKLNADGDISLAISNGRYCIIKAFADQDITVYDSGDSCLLPGTAVVNGDSPLTLHNSHGQNLTNYKIYGNSIQNGTPTPEAPIEIESVGDKTVNLFNPLYNFSGYDAYGITIDYLEDEDCFLINGTAAFTRDYADRWINIPITKGEFFSISIDYVSGNVIKPNPTDVAIAYFGAGDEIDTRNNWMGPSLYEYDTKFERKQCNYNYITRFWFYISAGVTFDNYKVKIQLQRGNTATEFEPYGEYKIPIKISNDNEEITTNIYLKEPLRKVGDYADYIDFETGIVKRLIKHDEFDGTETWKKSSAAENRFLTYVKSYMGNYSMVQDILLCDRLISSGSRKVGTIDISYSFESASGIELVLGFVFNTLDEMKQYVKEQHNAGTPMYTDYVLYKPTEETIELPNIPTFKGTTVIEVDTLIKPSNVAITY